MSHPPDLLLELLHQLMLEMFREGILTDEITSRVALRFEDEATVHRGNSRSERYATLARMAELFPFESAAVTGWRANDEGDIVPLTAVTGASPQA